MPSAHPIQPSFASGEVSPRLFGRVDLARYATGLETCENFIVMAHGGVRKRGGTRFIAEVKASANAVRLVPFTFSTEQAYVLEFGATYLRVFKDRGQVLDGSSAIYELATPYGQNDLDGLSFAQSADTLFIAHPGYAPRLLTRTGHASWSIATMAYKNGPFRALNPTATLKIRASASLGTVTLTATASVFVAGHVGALFRLYDESNSNPYSPLYAGAAISTGGLIESSGSVYRIAASSDGSGSLSSWSSEGKPSHKKGTVRFFESSSSAKYIDFEYRHSGFGIVRITAVTSATVATAVVQGPGLLPASVVSATAGEGTEYWQEGAWSPLRGYPAHVCFFEQRLWFAATPADPQTLWASRTNDYVNFLDGANDADALSYAIASNQVDAIQWLSPGKTLIVGATGAEYNVSASSLNEAVTPTNVRIAADTALGSSDVDPVRAGMATLFCQRHGVKTNPSRRLRELVYSFETDGLVAPDLTIMSEHVARAGLIELAWQPAPDAIVWAVRTDGQLIGLTYEREQQVVAWHRHVIGGVSDASGSPAKVERITTIPGADGDELWMVVRRRINGATKRYVEVLTYGLDETAALADATFADSHLTYSGAVAATLSGLTHLEGETVSILGDGAVHPMRVVASGAVALDPGAAKACVGLPYAATLKTLKIEAGAAGGTAQGRKKRISQVRLRVDRSLGGRVGPNADKLDPIETRSSADKMGQPPPLFTGDYEVDFDDGWNEDGQILLRHDQPLPITLLAIMPEVRTTG